MPPQEGSVGSITGEIDSGSVINNIPSHLATALGLNTSYVLSTSYQLRAVTGQHIIVTDKARFQIRLLRTSDSSELYDLECLISEDLCGDDVIISWYNGYLGSAKFNWKSGVR